MLIRSLVLSVTAFGLSASPLLSSAAGIQATITTLVANDSGTGSGNFALFLNDVPLAIVAQQNVSLGVGDVLRAEVSTDAIHVGTGTASSFNYRVAVDLSLDAHVTAAMIQTTFNGIANAGPVTAQSTAYSSVNCDFLNTGCSAPGLPLSTAFNSGVTSSTLSILPNKYGVNNVTTETGNVGGIETVNAVTMLSLQRELGLPTASVDVGALALAIFQATATTNATLEVTITELTAVPVPAALWLFGSALGLLAWRAGRR